MFARMAVVALVGILVACSMTTAQQARERTAVESNALRYNPGYNPNQSYTSGYPGYSIMPQPRWRLGVETENTRTGAVITDIYDGSAAHRQGLERGDAIVTINGYQVGVVEGQVHDISDEFTLRADRFGRVTLLVQDARDGRLVNLTIGLDSRDGNFIPIQPGIPTVPERVATIAGRVTFREVITLPTNARLRVELCQRPNRNSTQVTVIDEYNTRTLGNQKPLAYELSYRVGQLDPTKFYTVRAVLDVDRNVRLQSAAETPLSIVEPPSSLDLLIGR